MSVNQHRRGRKSNKSNKKCQAICNQLRAVKMFFGIGSKAMVKHQTSALVHDVEGQHTGGARGHGRRQSVWRPEAALAISVADERILDKSSALLDTPRRTSCTQDRHRGSVQ